MDVDNVRHVMTSLRNTNWLYRTLNESSVYEAAKKTIKVVSIANNPSRIYTEHHLMMFTDYSLTPFGKWININYANWYRYMLSTTNS